MNSLPFILLDQVSKVFADASRPSLHPTSLAIDRGDFVTVVGASGSGKTTLLKLINRLYEPTSGKVFVDGEDVSIGPAHHLRRRIGYVIQQVGLFQHMTIERNVATVPKILGWDKARIDARVNELLELVALKPADYRKRYPRQLSGGQQQRVGLARALAANPSLMLMDEPFGAIDALTRTNLQDELLAIQRRLKITVVFVTHDIPEALKLGDKVVVMSEGRIQQFDTPENILAAPANDFVRSLVGTYAETDDSVAEQRKLCGTTLKRIRGTC